LCDVVILITLLTFAALVVVVGVAVAVGVTPGGVLAPLRGAALRLELERCTFNLYSGGLF